MALSPVVTHVAESAQSQHLNSPLKNPVVSSKTSSNSTPRPASNNAISTAPTLDLAEQMNEEEKRKYIKGQSVIDSLMHKSPKTDVANRESREAAR
jgi:cyclin-dependent kinase 7